MIWDGLNRRRFPRVVYPCLIKLLSKTGRAKNLLTHTENIGIGGACVIIKQEVNLFSDVELEIDLLDTGEHVKAAGKVVWVVRRQSRETIKPMFYDVGIEFVNLDQQHKDHLKTTIDRIIKNGATVLKALY